ncbi:GSCOCG00011223001-RA-CDS, partial [Cotesia congregata]
LAYADDIALLAKNEDEMKGMIRTLERFVARKKLEVNVGKTKIMRCRKGGSRKRKVRWNWDGEEIEEVDRYTYGLEIWGWKGREEMERIQERYLRWVLGVSRRVGGYLVREELQRDQLESRAGLRAWSYEKRIEGGGGSIAWRCRMEMRKRIRAGRGLVG